MGKRDWPPVPQLEKLERKLHLESSETQRPPLYLFGWIDQPLPFSNYTFLVHKYNESPHRCSVSTLFTWPQKSIKPIPLSCFLSVPVTQQPTRFGHQAHFRRRAERPMWPPCNSPSKSQLKMQMGEWLFEIITLSSNNYPRVRAHNWAWFISGLCSWHPKTPVINPRATSWTESNELIKGVQWSTGMPFEVTHLALFSSKQSVQSESFRKEPSNPIDKTK